MSSSSSSITSRLLQFHRQQSPSSTFSAFAFSAFATNMNMNRYTHHPFLPNYNTHMDPYYPFSSDGVVSVNHHHLPPALPTQQMQYYHSLHTWTWSVDEDQVAIIESIDMYVTYSPPPPPSSATTHQPMDRRHHYQHLETVDEVAILENLDMYGTYSPPPSSSGTTHQPVDRRHHYQHLGIVDQVAILENLDIDESFEQGTALVGLTKEAISKNLKLTKIEKGMNWCEEEGEICAICQVELESNETVGLLRCKHRYHVECINEWLICKNECPVCKAQAFNTLV